MRYIMLLAAVLALGFTPVLNPDYLIVPGKSIGKYTLAMTLTDYLLELGPDPRITADIPQKGDNAYFWPEKSVVVWARDNRVLQIDIVTRSLGKAYQDGDPKVIALQENLEKYQTEKGISMRSAIDDVKAAYGEPDYTKDYQSSQFRISGLVFKKIGLYVEIESQVTSNTVVRIGVFDPSTLNWW